MKKLGQLPFRNNSFGNHAALILHEKNIHIRNYLSGTIFSDVAFSYITNQKQKIYLVPRHLHTPASNSFFPTPTFEIVIRIHNFTNILLGFFWRLSLLISFNLHSCFQIAAQYPGQPEIIAYIEEGPDITFVFLVNKTNKRT
jgi:hypothetical protein